MSLADRKSAKHKQNYDLFTVTAFLEVAVVSVLLVASRRSSVDVSNQLANGCLQTSW